MGAEYALDSVLLEFLRQGEGGVAFGVLEARVRAVLQQRFDHHFVAPATGEHEAAKPVVAP